jgi:hypothetical protein
MDFRLHPILNINILEIDFTMDFFLLHNPRNVIKVLAFEITTIRILFNN